MSIHHYLDNFFIAGAPNTSQCSERLNTPIALCELLNIALAEDKRKGPTTLMEYLGILLHSVALEAYLPADKLLEIKSSLKRWLHHYQCTKQELLSLIGTLSFAAKVVPTGRTFLQRMIDLSASAVQLQDAITLNEGFRLDIRWWTSLCNPLVRS